jgi:hypothetical protein
LDRRTTSILYPERPLAAQLLHSAASAKVGNPAN